MQKSIYFNGIEYRLMGTKKYYLSQSKDYKNRKGAKSLHVAIWEFHNNTLVPVGYNVHHIDGNYFNNDISNLELISKSKHLAEHAKEWHRNNKEKSKEQLDKVREKAKEWHKSEEGKKWHKEHVERSLKKIYGEPSELKCIECGKIFKAQSSIKQFCSNNCGNKFRQKMGAYDYSGICVVCAKEFHASKAGVCQKFKKTCCISCKNKLVNINKKLNQSKNI